MSVQIVSRLKIELLKGGGGGGGGGGVDGSVVKIFNERMILTLFEFFKAFSTCKLMQFLVI